MIVRKHIRGYSLIEFLVASTVAALLIGSLVMLTQRLTKRGQDQSARNETDLELASLAAEIIQRGATAAVDCSETAGTLECRSERGNGTPFQFRYAKIGQTLETQERVSPAAWQTVKIYRNISQFTVCQASKPGCALQNTFLHAPAAGNRNNRFFRFSISSNLQKGTKSTMATAGREYQRLIQSAFYVRNPYLSSDPSVKLVGGGKKL